MWWTPLMFDVRRRWGTVGIFAECCRLQPRVTSHKWRKTNSPGTRVVADTCSDLIAPTRDKLQFMAEIKQAYFLECTTSVPTICKMRPSILLFTLIKMMKWSQVLLEDGWSGRGEVQRRAFQHNVKEEGRWTRTWRRKCYRVEKEGKERWDYGQRYEERKFGRDKERGWNVKREKQCNTISRHGEPQRRDTLMRGDRGQMDGMRTE